MDGVAPVARGRRPSLGRIDNAPGEEDEVGLGVADEEQEGAVTASSADDGLRPVLPAPGVAAGAGMSQGTVP